MNFYLVTLSIFLYCLSILNPAFYPPWTSFISEYFAFLALLCLLTILFEKNIYIPKMSIFFILISCIPIFQYFSYQIHYIDTASLSFLYLFSFWLTIIIGFNSTNKYKNNLNYFYNVILICGLISSLIAMVQWLHISINSDFLMKTSGRPFANMAQPNHLSTFLILSIISCLYCFEKGNINNKLLFFFSIILLISVSLTQSRTAWIIFLFLSLYWFMFYKKNKLKLSYKIIILYWLIFISFSIFFPILKEYLFRNKTISVLDRASSGHERIQIWQQAIEAIKLKPLTGYGWNQSSFAQFDTIRNDFIKHKLTSFHNIILDILVWCGIPLGISILVLFSYFIFKYLINSYNFSQICAVSFIVTILIHALLEFPLHYSYFLFPIGFLLGYLSFSFKEKALKINGIIFIFIFLVGSFLSFYIFREYSQIPDNMVAAEQHEMNEIKDDIVLPYKMVFFKSFEHRAEWISLYTCTKVEEEKLNELKYMVKTYMIHYDLIKFSKLLVYNGYIEQSKQYLNKINYMYNKKYTISDLQCSSEL